MTAEPTPTATPEEVEHDGDTTTLPGVVTGETQPGGEGVAPTPTATPVATPAPTVHPLRPPHPLRRPPAPAPTP